MDYVSEEMQRAVDARIKAIEDKYVKLEGALKVNIYLNLLLELNIKPNHHKAIQVLKQVVLGHTNIIGEPDGSSQDSVPRGKGDRHRKTESISGQPQESID